MVVVTMGTIVAAIDVLLGTGFSLCLMAMARRIDTLANEVKAIKKREDDTQPMRQGIGGSGNHG